MAPDRARPIAGQRVQRSVQGFALFAHLDATVSIRLALRAHLVEPARHRLLGPRAQTGHRAHGLTHGGSVDIGGGVIDGLLTGQLRPQRQQDDLLDVVAVVLGDGTTHAAHGMPDEASVIAHEGLEACLGGWPRLGRVSKSTGRGCGS